MPSLAGKSKNQMFIIFHLYLKAQIFPTKLETTKITRTLDIRQVILDTDQDLRHYFSLSLFIYSKPFFSKVHQTFERCIVLDPSGRHSSSLGLDPSGSHLGRVLTLRVAFGSGPSATRLTSSGVLPARSYYNRPYCLRSYLLPSSSNSVSTVHEAVST